MNSKTFKAIIAIISGFLAGAVFFGISMKQPILPLVALLAAAFVIMLLKPKAKMVVKDEMLDQLAGKAAKTSMLIFVIIALVVGVVLMAAPDGDWAEYRDVGYALAYFASGILILYSILMAHYTRKMLA